MGWDSSIRGDIDRLRQESNAARKRESEYILDFYLGETERYLDPKPGELRADFDARQKYRVNIVRDIISKLSLIYQQPPMRSIDGPGVPEEFVKMMRRVWAYGDMNATDQYTDAMCRLFGNVAQRVYWLEDESRVEFVPILPDNLDIKQDPLNPLKVVEASVETCTAGTDQAKIAITRTTFTPTEVHHYEDGKEVEWAPGWGTTNPVGAIPLVFYRNDIDPRNWWVDGFGEELANANRAINNLLSDLLYLIEYQAYSQPVLEDCDGINGEQRVGPKSPLKIPQGGKFRFETPDPNIPGVLSAINTLLDLTYQTSHLSQSPLRIAVFPSGLALQAAKSEVLDDLYARQRRFGDRERERIILALRVWCAAKGVPLPNLDTLEIRVKWQPIRLPIDTDQRIRLDAFRLSSGLVDKATLLREDNPELSEDEADALIEKYASENPAVESPATDAISAATQSFRLLQQQRQQASSGAA